VTSVSSVSCQRVPVTPVAASRGGGRSPLVTPPVYVGGGLPSFCSRSGSGPWRIRGPRHLSTYFAAVPRSAGAGLPWRGHKGQTACSGGVRQATDASHRIPRGVTPGCARSSTKHTSPLLNHLVTGGGGTSQSAVTLRQGQAPFHATMSGRLRAKRNPASPLSRFHGVPLQLQMTTRRQSRQPSWCFGFFLLTPARL